MKGNGQTELPLGLSCEEDQAYEWIGAGTEGHDLGVCFLGGYGTDETIGLSAWVSTCRQLTPERIAKLTSFLWRLFYDGHHAPFEKIIFHYVVKVDKPIASHLLKHRIGVSIGSSSDRYRRRKISEFFVPSDAPVAVQGILTSFCENAFKLYQDAAISVKASLVEQGVSSDVALKRSKEIARYFLPGAYMEDMDIQFNGRSFLHYQGLRNSEHAQREDRLLAEAMLRQLEKSGQAPVYAKIVRFWTKAHDKIPAFLRGLADTLIQDSQEGQ